MKIKNVRQVAEWRLCLGCGACAAACPEDNIRLVDVEREGIRPFLQTASCKECGTCVQVCPGVHYLMENSPAATEPTLESESKRWGRVLELWEGYAADAAIRYKGSSGGLCTALALYCLEQGLAGGVVHVGADAAVPWRNRTFRSTSRAEVVSRTGSRYAPASPCDGLRLMEAAEQPSVFIGKPCDVAGLRRTQTLRPLLAQKTALAVGFFCAGTPSTLGTLELFREHGVDSNQIAYFRYRGNGWPGLATAQFKDRAQPPFQLTYAESWGFVNKYRPFRCYLCPDLTAEFADIAVGDPWYRAVGEDEPGRSLILVRTELGRRIFHQALQAGYVKAQPAQVDIIYRSQHNLLTKRQALWGRQLAMKVLRIPTPEVKGFHLFANWRDLSLKEKVKSVLGTVRRIVQRNYFRPIRY